VHSCRNDGPADARPGDVAAASTLGGIGATIDFASARGSRGDTDRREKDMYLFSRVATLRGNERRTLAWAAEVTSYVNDHCDHDLTLWRADFGYPVGTVAWSTWADSMDSLNRGFAPLAEDDGYFALLDEGAELVAEPPRDLLRRAVHGEPGGTPPPPGAVTQVTTAVVANGKYAEATAWGVEMADLVQQVTNQPTMFLVDAYSTFGQVTWLSGAPGLAAADAAADAIQGDADYLKRLADVGDLFLPGSGQQRLVTRIA
jgi:hypothetical protein